MSNELKEDKLRILFMPLGGCGPMNNCIGIGHTLQEMGHQCVFVVESSWKGKLIKYGFIEKSIHLSGENENGDGFWDKFFSNQVGEFRKSPFDQIKTFIYSTWKAFIDGVKFGNQQLKNLVEEIQPNIIIADNGIIFPALITNKQIPFVRIVSCNPLEIHREDRTLPPAFSGLPLNDQSKWKDFQNEYLNIIFDLWNEFNHWIKEQGASSLPKLEFIHISKYLNFYIYPEIIDYPTKSFSSLWTRLDSCVRQTENENHFQIPSHFQNSKIIYVSLGTLGYHDTNLIKRLIHLFEKSKYYFLFSLGSKYDQYINLPKNISGYEYLPQPIVLPLVDLVITHGGNNTVCESLHFGKPMIILPLFWDQHDNAQHLHELQYGIHLNTYTFTDEQMFQAIEYLINNQKLQEHLATISQSIRDRNGLQLAAQKIEQCAYQAKYHHLIKQ